MTSKFTWVPIYRELANRLVDQEACQSELITLLEQIRADGIKVTPLTDQDDQGAHFLMKGNRSRGSYHRCNHRNPATVAQRILFFFEFPAC